MNCEQIQPNLLDYGRKLLTGPEYEQVKTHVSKCADCAALLRQEMATYEKLARIAEVSPPHDVWALVRSRTKPRRVRPLVWLHSLIATNLRKAATAAIAMALLAVGFYNVVLVNPEPSTSKPPVVVTVYSDDPLGGHTDAVVASIDDM